MSSNEIQQKHQRWIHLDKRWVRYPDERSAINKEIDEIIRSLMKSYGEFMVRTLSEQALSKAEVLLHSHGTFASSAKK